MLIADITTLADAISGQVVLPGDRDWDAPAKPSTYWSTSPPRRSPSPPMSAT